MFALMNLEIIRLVYMAKPFLKKAYCGNRICFAVRIQKCAILKYPYDDKRIYVNSFCSFLITIVYISSSLPKNNIFLWENLSYYILQFEIFLALTTNCAIAQNRITGHKIIIVTNFESISFNTSFSVDLEMSVLSSRLAC